MCTYYPNFVNENNHILLRITIKYLFLFSIVFNLWSCKPSSYFETKNSATPINDTYSNNAQADSLIQPYKIKLDTEMNEVLVISAEEFPIERGKSETKLGNLVTYLSLVISAEKYNNPNNQHIDFCLLNFGGLRTSLPKGPITRGKIFELMPFENELVVVTITKEKLDKLFQYLQNTPQPIYGSFTVVFNENSYTVYEDTEVYVEGSDDSLPKQYEYIKVLTTDYLAHGGDNMNFFLNPIKIEPIGIKLRDAIIQYCDDERMKGRFLKGEIREILKYE
jgi:5'-nucleotidase